MKTLALKVDVNTFRGTKEGVPRLVELFKARGINASFMFSLGPDHSGRALKKLFCRDFFKQITRTSMLEHYGPTTMLYGTLLPAPDIGRRWANTLRGVEADGFDVGMQGWDRVRWQEGVVQANAEWTKYELELAAERFVEIFGRVARAHAAAGWQMNRTAFRLQQRMGLSYSSDTRGLQPFWPVVEGEPIQCVQIPTTLPTVDELLGVDGITVETVHNRLVRAALQNLPCGHVYTLQAELEGMKLLPAFERMLDGWTEQGYEIISLAELYGRLDLKNLPYHAVEMAPIEGRRGLVALQGDAYPE